MIPEVGDKFVINWERISQWYPSVKPCKFPDLEFTIDSFTKSKLSVYFKNESYKKCPCQNCRVYDNSIGVADIIITKKRIAIDRDRKLGELLN